MKLRESLDRILQRWSLLQHPFYRAWNEGSLSTGALQLYAAEYADFIALLPGGWEQLDQGATAEEEREHIKLWRDFAAALGAGVGPASLPQTKALREKAAELFAHPVSALGALYAFEAQQPATAESKLKGLRSYYELPETAHAYFRVHQNNGDEAEVLLARMENLPQAEQLLAARACEDMAEALWEGLSGIQAAASVD